MRDESSPRNFQTRAGYPRPSRAGRDANREDGEPVVEVLPEALLPHFLREVPDSCRDHPDVDLQRPRAPEPFELAARGRRRKLRLHVRGELADPRRGRASSRSRSRSADLPRQGPGVGPLLPPKSSLSTRPAGRAAQFTSRGPGPPRRLSRWIAWATSSLPLPVSPWTRPRSRSARPVPRGHRTSGWRRSGTGDLPVGWATLISALR